MIINSKLKGFYQAYKIFLCLHSFHYSNDIASQVSSESSQINAQNETLAQLISNQQTKLDDLTHAVSRLEEQCNQMLTQLSSLSSVKETLEKMNQALLNQINLNFRFWSALIAMSSHYGTFIRLAMRRKTQYSEVEAQAAILEKTLIRQASENPVYRLMKSMQTEFCSNKNSD